MLALFPLHIAVKVVWMGLRVEYADFLSRLTYRGILAVARVNGRIVRQRKKLLGDAVFYLPEGFSGASLPRATRKQGITCKEMLSNMKAQSARGMPRCVDGC